MGRKDVTGSVERLGECCASELHCGSHRRLDLSIRLFLITYGTERELDMVAHAYYPSTWRAEAVEMTAGQGASRMA